MLLLLVLSGGGTPACASFTTPGKNRCTGDFGNVISGARYYDPQLGRFIQPDRTAPNLGDPQSLNRYSYCRNNPLNAVDPSGNDPVEPSDPFGDDQYAWTGFNSSASSWLQPGNTFTEQLLQDWGLTTGGSMADPWQQNLQDVNGQIGQLTDLYNATPSGQIASELWNMVPLVGGLTMLGEAAVGSDFFTGQTIQNQWGYAAMGGLNLGLSLAAFMPEGAALSEGFAPVKGILGPEGPGQFVLQSGEGSLETAGVVRTGEQLNRVFDSRWQLGSPYSQPLGGSFSPGSTLPTSSSQAFIDRGLNWPGVVNNAQMGVIYSANQNLEATFRTSLGGVAPEVLIAPLYRSSLQQVGGFVPIAP